MNEKEIEIFNELKEFLKDVNDGIYSSSDAFESLVDFHEKLEQLE